MTDPLVLMQIQLSTLFIVTPDGKLLAGNEPKRPKAPRVFLGRTANGNVWAVRSDLDSALATELDRLAQAERPRLETSAPDPKAYVDVLSRHSPADRIYSGPAYCFPNRTNIMSPLSTSVERGLGGEAERGPGGEVEMGLGGEVERGPGGQGGRKTARAKVIDVTKANATVLERYFKDWLADVNAGVPMAAALEGKDAVSLCCSVRITKQAHEAGVETHEGFRGKGLAAQVTARWARVVRSLGAIPLYSTSWDNVASQAVAKKLRLIQYGSDLHIT